MKLAHIADPHLGIRQYHRQTPTGINQREADVAQAFRAAIDGVIAARPDAVVVAGDLFHSVRPTNAAIVFAFRQFQRLREALPEAPIVLIAGNHDTPRSAETGSILRLFEELGVDVADRRAPAAGVSASSISRARRAAPGADGARRGPCCGPKATRARQVLVLHGEIEGVFPFDRSGAEYGGAARRLAESCARRVDLRGPGPLPRAAPGGPRRLVRRCAGLRRAPTSGVSWRTDRTTGSTGRAGCWWTWTPGRSERRPVPRGPRDPRPRADGGRRAVGRGQSTRLIAERVAAVPGGVPTRSSALRVLRRAAPRGPRARTTPRSGRSRPTRCISIWTCAAPRPSAPSASGRPGGGRPAGAGRSYLERRPLPAELDRDAFVRLGRGADGRGRAGPGGRLMQIHRLRLLQFPPAREHRARARRRA